LVVKERKGKARKEGSHASPRSKRRPSKSRDKTVKKRAGSKEDRVRITSSNSIRMRTGKRGGPWEGKEREISTYQVRGLCSEGGGGGQKFRGSNENLLFDGGGKKTKKKHIPPAINKWGNCLRDKEKRAIVQQWLRKKKFQLKGV